MIDFEHFELENGLQVLVHPDPDTPAAVVNILYQVGSRDEDPEHTGFAHLFEHLMFGGSENVSNFDQALEQAGGRNNAFTTPDITNYYDIVPANNIETAFWLESDRMNALDFNPQTLKIQKQVVSEEFKERYLNRPYGDVSLQLRPLAYQKHPYRWPTIGQKLEHIENTTLQQVKDFFYTYYRPNNAVLSVAGKVTPDQVRELAEKWFGDIPPGKEPERHYPAEPLQQEARTQTLKSAVPRDAIYKAWHMCARTDPEFYTLDLISDLLGHGDSSRLNQILVKEQELFYELDAYITGSLDQGLLIVEGKLNEGVSFEEGEEGIDNQIRQLREETIEKEELTKVQNKVISLLQLSRMHLPVKAEELAYFHVLEDAGWINREADQYRAVTPEEIQQQADQYLTPAQCSTIYYQAEN